MPSKRGGSMRHLWMNVRRVLLIATLLAPG